MCNIIDYRVIATEWRIHTGYWVPSTHTVAKQASINIHDVLEAFNE